MCISPIPIKNLNRGFLSSYRPEHWYLKDRTSMYVGVPCRHCSQCVSRRQTDLIQRCEIEALDCWVYYGTLTYNNESLPILQLGDYSYRYADISDVQDMMKRLRVDNVFRFPFKYLVVSERGEKKGRPHFHLLLFFKKDDIGDIQAARSFGVQQKWTLLKYWKRNTGDRNHVHYQDLCTYCEKFYGGILHRNYDFHFVEPSLTSSGCSDVCFYVSSYMFQDFDKYKKLKYAIEKNYPPDEAYDILLKLRDKCVKSVKFGITEKSEKIVKSSLSSSVNVGFPQLYINGRSFPLSRYYFRYMTVDDKLRMYNSVGHLDKYPDIFKPVDYSTSNGVRHSPEAYKRKVNLIKDKSLFPLFNSIFYEN